MTQQLVFDPLLPWGVIAALALLAGVILAFGAWRRLGGTLLRLAAAACLLVALANPALQRETRQAMSDIVLIMVDDSASQRIGARPEQTATALAALQTRLGRLPNTEVQVVTVTDDPEDGGTLAMARLAEALAEIPRARLAGVFLISDGQVHDAQSHPDLPAPLHLLLTGAPQDWDRRLVIDAAPAFAILGQPVSVLLHIEDQGLAPADRQGPVELTISIGAEPPVRVMVPVGQPLELPVNLPHGGMNVVQMSIAPEAGELTDRNNAAVVQINGVRDRLRVLLVSGEPHAGERVWRNLLKSDPSVDLVHFTILRPPGKEDGARPDELSLIAFPIQELFVDKINEFDLIIFDRYRRRGILPMSYFQNVRDYVRKGGAVLVSGGPEFGSADSIWRSPLGEVLPAAPTGRILEEGFQPQLTDLGRRHPVTAGLQDSAPEGGWGRWYRQLEVEARQGQIVMQGARDLPLLILDRVGQGRVGMLASDHIWLWGRGHEGGGPQLELLRRLAHWTMKEPDLEEEALSATARGQTLTVTRRTLGDDPGPLRITAPDGQVHTLTLTEGPAGQWQGRWQAPDMGLYRLEQGDLRHVLALGPSSPREFMATLASAEPLQPVLQATGGTAISLSQGLPEIRLTPEGRQAFGRGWLGVTPRQAFVTQDLRLQALVPHWLAFGLGAGLMLAAWLWEGRRRRLS